MIKYLGSKRVLAPAIVDAVRRVAGASCEVLDLFSGTSRVGHALKRAGHRVIANDHNAYAHTLARCYVQADREDVEHDAGVLIDEFNRLARGERGACEPGYFTRTFCERARFVQPQNGARIDAIREAIAKRGLEPDLEAVLLVSLMEAADRVDSTTGVQMAYLKQWSRRSFNELQLRMPDVLPRAIGAERGCEAHRMDALDAARRLPAEVVYVDPPYNQHSYLGNYHVWESLVEWDKPEVFGVACKRLDVRARRSAFNSRRTIECALRDVLTAATAHERCRGVVLSFSNEGFVSRTQLEAMLGSLFDGCASVRAVEHDYPRYVGAKIGVYNPRGERVGRVSHVRNTEVVYEVTRANEPRAKAVGANAEHGELVMP
ncbi:MAG: DNA adenine methylase [Planctomycetota bacterium]|nr:DNA adenine methylase [Planctomycetota bacterium]